MNLNDIKKWWRSGSLSYALDGRSSLANTRGKTQLKSYHWKNNNVHYRVGTSDVGIIYDVLIHRTRPLKPNRTFFRRKQLEYWVPQELNPRIILDIGANIGITGVYYSTIFPDAQIHCFEPVSENFELLEKNTGNINNISTYNVGLGDKDGEVDIYQCDQKENMGGFSLKEIGVDKSSKQTITLKEAKKFLSDNHISDIDLIKIDTEGAEYDILMSLGDDILSRAKWIIGELHGTNDFELLAYLSKWYDIDMHKTMNSRLFCFNARNKSLPIDIPWSG